MNIQYLSLHSQGKPTNRIFWRASSILAIRGKLGFTLIELIIASALGASVITASTVLFSQYTKFNHILSLKQHADSIAMRCYQYLQRKTAIVGYSANISFDNIDSSFLETDSNDIYDLRFPIEINEGQYFQPSNTKLTINSVNNSDILSYRFINNGTLFEFDGTDWYGIDDALEKGDIIFSSRANGGHFSQISKKSSRKITLHNNPQNAQPGERALIYSIRGERLYIKKNSNNEFALWRQRPSTSNPQKVINEQLVEHISHFYVQFAYGSTSLSYEDIPRKDTPPLAIRVGIIIGLPINTLYADRFNNDPMLFNHLIKPRDGFAQFAYEWVFPLAYYSPEI